MRLLKKQLVEVPIHKGVGPPWTFSSWVSWSVKQRLVLFKIKQKEKNCFGHGTVCMRWMDLELCTRDSWCKYRRTRELVYHAHSLSEFLGLWSKDLSSLKSSKRKNGLAMGLSACAEWILNFVQETAGVSTDPQGSWSTKHILFLSFLVCEAKTCPP